MTRKARKVREVPPINMKRLVAAKACDGGRWDFFHIFGYDAQVVPTLEMAILHWEKFPMTWAARAFLNEEGLERYRKRTLHAHYRLWRMQYGTSSGEGVGYYEARTHLWRTEAQVFVTLYQRYAKPYRPRAARSTTITAPI